MHIPGVANLEADFLSRTFSPKPPVKPRQLERVSLTPVTIGEGFWKVKRLTQPARKNHAAGAGGRTYRRFPLGQGCPLSLPQMGRFKRSLQGGGPYVRPTLPPPKRAGVLHEGFAIAPASQHALGESPVPAPALSEPGRAGEPRGYGRGSAAIALAAVGDPTACVARIWDDASASSSRGPFQSRKQLWESLARKAGAQDPFCLTPNIIFTVMGALKTAGYRSAEQYLDVAKAIHVSLGHGWTEQLAQARRLAIRSARRGLGHPKQAGGLPLASLGNWANQQEPLAAEGPTWPARATLLASWWLLREIEASRARKSHICQDVAELRITWRLPSSKTDQAALGAYRSHRCSCEFAPSSICPYHLMAAQLESLPPGDGPLFLTQDGGVPSKQGWADTFQALAARLGLATHHPNGARAYTGHSARVTGARHLASTQVELWRVQLFGRWGSEVFVHYIQEAPLAQLDSLALEASAKMSIQEAKLQLQDLLRRSSEMLNHPISSSPSDMLEDCEAGMDPASPQMQVTEELVLNLNAGGKLHRPLISNIEDHPRVWRTKCGWRFGNTHTDYEWIKSEEDIPAQARKCSKCFPSLKRTTSSSSSSSSSSSTSADPAGGKN